MTTTPKDPTLQRRTFIKAGIGGGAAAVLLPAWNAAQAPRDGSSMRERFKDGRATGKPVLVLLVPEHSRPGEQLRLWTELLAFASDATLAELALCEVTCAAPSQAAAEPRSAGLHSPDLEADDVAVLIETGGGPARRVSGRDLDQVVPPPPGTPDPYEHVFRERAARLAERIHAAILPDEGALARRAAAAREALGHELQVPTLLLGHHPRPILAHLHRAAAIVLADARAASSAEMESNLAHATLQRLWENAPDGARWNVTPERCPGCGMGSVPYSSRRFLTVYAG